MLLLHATRIRILPVSERTIEADVRVLYAYAQTAELSFFLIMLVCPLSTSDNALYVLT